MNRQEYEALRSALASARMEGLQISEQTKMDCLRLINGEISATDIVQEILTRPSQGL